MSGLNKKRFALIFGPCIIFVLLVILIFVNKSPVSPPAVDSLAESDLPTIKQNIFEFALSAESFISVYVSKNGEDKILIEKEKNRQLPIASITKLMTALIASEEYTAKDIVTVSRESLLVKGVSGLYQVGDKLFFSDALFAMLVASHNELASALAEKIGVEKFVDLMNKKTLSLGLSNTRFVNSVGTDSDINSGPINHSTADDLYRLARYIRVNKPDILSITTTKELDLFDSNKKFIEKIKNTNKLLTQKDFLFNIIGGKTGETPRAKKNLVLVIDAPCAGTIYSVVLGSEDNFDDMEKLLKYTSSSYSWNCKI
ncbi:MAG: serine hydrolase [Patescibacteria group bacterium]